VPGILNARTALATFRYDQVRPVAALAPYVETYWVVSWDRRGREPYEQWVLPYPSVNLTFKPGRCRIVGVPRGRFSEVLTGAARVFGVRFRPGGFRAFLDAPVASITDRIVSVESVFGPSGTDLATAVLAADDRAAADLLDQFLVEFLVGRSAGPDPALEQVTAIVDRIAADPAPLRVDDLATEFDLNVRQLQRLFAEYIGVGPKWTIRRYRLHEAAGRLAAGVEVDPVVLAADLGYSDQAHFTRDFAAIAGVPPARYARAQ
jgi:AraC-like DNA-binding protein